MLARPCPQSSPCQPRAAGGQAAPQRGWCPPSPAPSPPAQGRSWTRPGASWNPAPCSSPVENTATGPRPNPSHEEPPTRARGGPRERTDAWRRRAEPCPGLAAEWLAGTMLPKPPMAPKWGNKAHPRHPALAQASSLRNPFEKHSPQAGFSTHTRAGSHPAPLCLAQPTLTAGWQGLHWDGSTTAPTSPAAIPSPAYQRGAGSTPWAPQAPTASSTPSPCAHVIPPNPAVLPAGAHSNGSASARM